MMVDKSRHRHAVKYDRGLKRSLRGSDIYLFGSRARGDERPDSDWDVLVLVDREKVSFAFENEILNAVYDVLLNDTRRTCTPFIVSGQDIVKERIYGC